MPCGHRDQRRQGHRCLQCRQRHRKCDGRQPCGSCINHKVRCEQSMSSRPIMTVVEYRPPASKQPLARGLVVDSWLYFRFFFETLDSSDSMLLSAFSFGEIGHLAQGNGRVFDAVAAVGATYLHQTPTSHRLSSLDSENLFLMCSTLRKQIADELNLPSALRAPYFLLRAQLLGLIELMTDDTGHRWDQLVDGLWNSSSPAHEYAPPPTDLHPSILSVGRLNINLRLLLKTDDELTDECLALARPDFPLVEGALTEFLVSPGEKMEFLARTLERWTVMKYRAFKWLKGIQSVRKDQSHYGAHPQESFEHLSQQALEGLEIVCLACEFQQEIIGTLLASSITSLSDPGRDFMHTFYQFILIDWSRMFAKPEWHTQDWTMPVMNAALINEQALLALDGAEKSVARGRLDAVLYAAISPVVGGGISSIKDRARIMRLLKLVKDKGFAIASSFEPLLLGGWRESA